MKLQYLLVSILFLCSCSSVQTRRASPEKSGSAFDEPTAPSNGGAAEGTQKSPQHSMVLEQNEARKVALIFGPGAAKTLAYPAILKSFAQKRIPVQKVVGIEWGALTAAIFALNAKPHEAEWKIFKFDPKTVQGGGLFGRGADTSVSSLDGFLKENLTEASTSSISLPFECPALSLKRGTVSLKSDEKLWLAVRNCLSSSPRLTPANEWAAAYFSLKEVSDNLRREGYNTLIFVNALGGNELFGPDDKSLTWGEKLLWLEIRREVWAARGYFTDFIEIDSKGFSLFNFKAKKELTQLGQKAGEASALALISKYGF